MSRVRFIVLLALAPTLGGCASFWNCISMLRGGPPIVPEFRTADPQRAAAPAEPAAPEGNAGPRVLARQAAFTAVDEAASLFLVNEARQAPYREPQKAFCLACLIAGGGHFYTGETKKGAALLGIAAAGLIGGAVLSSGESDDPFDCEYNPETFECEPESNRTPLLIGAGVAAASWIYGIVDSRPSAARVNARNGHQIGGAAVEMQPVLGLTRGGEPGAGLHVRVRW